MTRPFVNTYHPEIDGLRAVAVLAVILFHLGVPLVPGGYAGVDVFFVISGFLITRLIASELQAGKFSLFGFYVRRVRRLLPAFLCVVILCLLVAPIALSPAHLQEFARSLISSLLLAPNLYFWQESGYFATDAAYKPLLHTWSLGVEEQFYLVWPSLLALTWRKTSEAGVLMVIVLAGVLSLVFAEALLGSSPAAVFYLMPFRVFEFAVGAAAVWVVRAYAPGPISGNMVVIAGLALILGVFAVFTPETRFPGLSAGIPTIGALFVILGASSWTGRVLLGNQIAVGLGRISYSLYLVHWPMIAFYQYMTFDQLDNTEAVAILVLAVVLSIAMYRFVEMPFRLRREGGYVVPDRSMGAAILLAVVAVLVAVPMARDGWPWRGDGGEIYTRLTAADTGAGHAETLHQAYYGGRDCPGGDCQLGSAGPRFLVLGDSHARMLHAGIQKAFETSPGQAAFFSDQGCGWLVADRLKRCSKRHDPKRDAFIQHLMNSNIEYLVFAQRWRKYAYSSRGAPVATDWSGVIARNIDALRSSGRLTSLKTIYVVGQVPEYAGYGDVFTCLTRPYPSLLGAASGNCARASLTHSNIKKSAQVNTSLLAALARLPNREVEVPILMLDPFRALCDGESCRQMIAGEPLYSDKDHLSVEGSMHVVGQWLDLLQLQSPRRQAGAQDALRP